MSVDLDKVSVVIPTYNRFKYLLNTIASVKSQTYKNIEIIVVNDNSTQKEYYTYNWNDTQIKIIHLTKNTKELFGYACAGYVRNEGIKHAEGKYIAFCDDDDIWFPRKIELQLKKMNETNCKMSSTDGLIGNGMFNINQRYKRYNAEYFFNQIKNIYRRYKIILNNYPDIWNYNFIRIHNCIITSSVLIEKEILSNIGLFNNLKNGKEDYDCWLRALKHTNCAYIRDICFYYDNGHGDGQNY